MAPGKFNSPEGDLENHFITESWLIDQYLNTELWAWGANSYGQLGLNNTIMGISTPVTTFAGGPNWKYVDCGTVHTIAIKTDGTLWCWGRNNNQQLGVGTTATAISTPVTTFIGGNDWKTISAGGDQSAAIKTDGTLWTWGANSYGQLGINTTSVRSTPVQVGLSSSWKQVSFGDYHMLAIKTDGTLWTWGNNNRGQLGINTTTNRITPVQVGVSSDWSKVSGGGFHSSAIKTDGTLWTWGYNVNGQLGNNTTTNILTPVTTFSGGKSWKQCSNSPDHTVAVKTDGTLWVWGNNIISQLGLGTTVTSYSVPVQVGVASNWKEANCSGMNLCFSAAIKTDGTLWTWGYNGFSQLGTNTSAVAISTPVTTFAGGNNWRTISCAGGWTYPISGGVIALKLQYEGR